MLTGEEGEFPCEMKQAWKPAQFVPRTYLSCWHFVRKCDTMVEVDRINGFCEEREDDGTTRWARGLSEIASRSKCSVVSFLCSYFILSCAHQFCTYKTPGCPSPLVGVHSPPVRPIGVDKGIVFSLRCLVWSVHILTCQSRAPATRIVVLECLLCARPSSS